MGRKGLQVAREELMEVVYIMTKKMIYIAR